MTTTINDLFDDLERHLVAWIDKRPIELVRQIRSRLLTPEAVDGLDDDVCDDIFGHVFLSVGFPSGVTSSHENARIGRGMARAIATHLCVVRTDGDAVPDSRPIIRDAAEATDEQCRKAFNAASRIKRSPQDHVGFVRDFIAAALDAVRLDASPRQIISNADAATEEQCLSVANNFLGSGGAVLGRDKSIEYGRNIIRFALSSAAIDASPMLTEKEFELFENTLVKTGHYIDFLWSMGGNVDVYTEEIRRCRAALTRLKIGKTVKPATVLTAEEKIAFARVFWSAEAWLDIVEKNDPSVRSWRANFDTARAAFARLSG